MAQKKTSYVKMQCAECKRVNYFLHKSKGLTEKKLEMKKYCKWCKKHTPHKESKKA